MDCKGIHFTLCLLQNIYKIRNNTEAKIKPGISELKVLSLSHTPLIDIFLNVVCLRLNLQAQYKQHFIYISVVEGKFRILVCRAI